MNAYARLLADNLRRTMPELSEQVLDRIRGAVDRVDPKGRRATERVDEIVGYVLGLGDRPRLERADAPRILPFIAGLGAAVPLSDLDVRVLDLAVQPAVWCWDTRGRTAGSVVALALRLAEVAATKPEVDLLGALSRALEDVDGGQEALLLEVLQRAPEVATTTSGPSRLGRRLLAVLAQGRLPWWTALRGRRGIVVIARLWAQDDPERLQEELPTLIEAAGRTFGPQLAEALLRWGPSALHEVADCLLQAAEAPAERLAAARVILDTSGDRERSRALIEPVFAEAMAVPDPDLAIEAAVLSAAVDGPAAAPQLHAAARVAPGPDARARVAEAALHLGAAGPVLIARLVDDAVREARGAARGQQVQALLAGLARLDVPMTFGPDRPHPFSWLNHSSKPVREGAALGLAPLGAVARAEVARRWSGATVRERLAVVALLGAQDDPEAQQELTDIARRDASAKVREAAQSQLPASPAVPESSSEPASADAVAHSGVQASPAVPEVSSESASANHAAPMAVRSGPSSGSDAAPMAAPPGPDLQARLTKAEARLRQPVRAWLDESSLPPLLDADGVALPEAAVRLLLKRASQQKQVGWPEDAAAVQAAASPASCAALGVALTELFLSRGAQASDKFCLLAGLALAGPQAVSRLFEPIARWPKARRGRMAEYALEALAVTDDALATLALDAMARRFRTTYPKVGEVARRVLATRAQRLDTAGELLVLEHGPRFGFDRPVRDVEVGRKILRVGLDLESNLRLRYEDGKTPKSVPKAVPEPVRGELDLLRRCLKPALAAHKAFVQDALLLSLRIPAPIWRRAFVEDPIRFVFGARQVWLCRTAAGTTAFRALADGSLTLVGPEAFVLPDDAQVELLHPIFEAPPVVEAWRAHFAAHRLTTFVRQLDLPAQAPEVTHGLEQTLHSGRACDPYERARYARRAGWRVSGIYEGGEPEFTKIFPGPCIATLHIDGGRDRVRALTFADGAKRPLPLSAVPAPIHAQALHELDVILSGGY